MVYIGNCGDSSGVRLRVLGIGITGSSGRQRRELDGPYAVESQVGFIEFKSKESQYFDQSHPLRELPSAFDEHLRRRVH